MEKLNQGKSEAKKVTLEHNYTEVVYDLDTYVPSVILLVSTQLKDDTYSLVLLVLFCR